MTLAGKPKSPSRSLLIRVEYVLPGLKTSLESYLNHRPPSSGSCWLLDIYLACGSMVPQYIFSNKYFWDTMQELKLTRGFCWKLLISGKWSLPSFFNAMEFWTEILSRTIAFWRGAFAKTYSLFFPLFQ